MTCIIKYECLLPLGTDVLSITKETERNEKLLVSLSRMKAEKTLIEENLSKVKRIKRCATALSKCYLLFI